MTESELLQILARSEDSRHQFKRDLANPDGVAAELAAQANSGGGAIFIGVADDGSITGLDGAAVRRLNQLLSNAASQHLRPPVHPLTENVQTTTAMLGRWNSPVMTARPKKRMFFTKSLIDLVDIGCTADTPLVSVELRASNRVTASCFCVVCIGSRVIAGQRLRVTTQQKGGLTRPAISRACPLRTCLASHVLPHVSAR